MKPADRLWQRLTAAARQAPAPPAELPWGQVDRIVARWQSAEAEETATVEIMAWMGRRVLVSAVLVTTVAVALSYLPLDDTWTVLTSSAPWLEVVTDL